MEQQEQLLSKTTICLCLILFTFFSCSENKTAAKKEIPQTFINTDTPGWREEGPLLYYKDVLFSGSQFRLYPGGDTAFLSTYYQGKKEGLHLEWYPDKKQKEIRHYTNGWQEGEQQGWFENGNRKFIYHFKNDVYDGNVKEWMEDGKLFKDFNYANGQESGKELLLNTDGSIRANYEVRNGKIYGNIGSKMCASPWNKDSL